MQAEVDAHQLCVTQRFRTTQASEERTLDKLNQQQVPLLKTSSCLQPAQWATYGSPVINLRVGIGLALGANRMHTWASWHVQAGTPLFVLQELGSWESPEMVQRYAHLSTDHLTDYVD